MANTKVQSEQIEDGSITADKIADGAIVATELADNSVTTAKINADAVTGAKIADDAINSEHYTDGSIDTAHIADDQITQAKMANDSVGADELASNAVVTASIVDANVTTAKIADGNISTAKIADNAVTSAKVDTNIDIAGTFDVTGATTLDSTLNVAGIVGIGNTNASSFNSNSNNLVVGSGSGGEGITIYSANDNNAQIFFADGTTGDAAYRGVLRYAHDVDRFEFFTAGAIRAVLDSSGNLGIGTTSPVVDLQVGSATSSVDANLLLAAGVNAYSRLYMGDATTGTGLYAGLLMYDHGNDEMSLFTSSTQRVTIGSGGNVGIGTTSPAQLLHVETTASPIATFRYNSTNRVDVRYDGLDIYGGSFRFLIAGTERMRIGSGVDVGSTSGASAGGVSAYVADNDTAFYANGSNGRVNIKIHTEAVGGKIWYLRTGGTAHFGSGGGDFMVLNEEGTAIMVWDYSASTINGDFNDTSDVGLKENIADITDAITTIKALKPRTFDWKEKTKAKNTHGFIAQEVETVLPNDVVGENYDANNPEHGSKALNTSGLLAVAVKAIQEQQTIIDDLKARIEALES